MSLKKYKVILSYDGTLYKGWQKQKGVSSVQQTVEKAFSQILRIPISLIGSSRTDAGVHALGQTAHFETPSFSSLPSLLYSVNCVLPPDIRVLALEEVEPCFHARYSACAKIYHYYLEIAPFSSPFRYRHSLAVYKPLDLQRLAKGCSLLQGKHDFTSFANEAHQGCAKNKPVKTLYSVKMKPLSQGICLCFHGDGFLYKMVRNLVGALLLVGKRTLPPEALLQILQAKDRKKAPATAPARGLFLMKVFYTPSQIPSDLESHLIPQNEITWGKEAVLTRHNL